jgi:hypothetical protein
MPRVGDPDASSILRMAAEFGYLSFIVAGCCFDRNLHRYGTSYLPTFRYWSKALRNLGEPWMAWNFFWLVLDKINSPFARPWSRGRI